MRNKPVTIEQVTRIARSLGLQRSNAQIAADTQRANQHRAQVLSFENIVLMRESEQQRHTFPETIRTGSYDPVELIVCWYEEAARQVVAEAQAADVFYSKSYGW